jgi:hypothetical protein
MLRRAWVACAAMLLTFGLGAAVVRTYSSYASWASSPVTVLINPANADVSANAAINAIQYAMDVWGTQGGTSLRYQYGGVASDTATAYDNRNVVFFRNASNGSTIATTYSWWDSSNHLVDSDVIFWDGGFTFYTGTTGCGPISNSAYIEDIATHELGHMLGLNHSPYPDATMYGSYGSCSQEMRSLSSDDIAGVQSLYGAVARTNTPPAVSITSPANGATFVQGTSISVAGSAWDAEDGDITSKLQWTDNGSNIGTGGLLSTLLNVLGTHTYDARATDSDRASGSSQVTITVTVVPAEPLSAPASATLSATGRRVKRLEKVDLRWSGVGGALVDVYRNANRVASPSNSGAYTDSINLKGAGTYNYQVCESGSQSNCTNWATVSF